MKPYVTILGIPRSKKNNREWKGGRLAQSDAWRRYEKDSIPQIRTARCRCFLNGRPLHVVAIYYMPSFRKDEPDPVNLMGGTADLLEKGGIIANDRQIRFWDGSHISPNYDPINPRVEVFIFPLGEEGWPTWLPYAISVEDPT